MRIPTSVIVMSVVTATPFGLAIRDTLKHKPPKIDADDELGLADYESRSARTDRERLAEYQAEAEREAAERAKSEAEKLESLDTVFGHDKASLGSLFAGAELGGLVPSVVEGRLENVMQDGFLYPSLEKTGDALSGVRVDIYSSSYESACSTLRRKLVEAWGPSSNGVWTNPGTHMRATLTSDSSCSLGFALYLEPADWIAQLPLDAIGQSGEKLEAKLVGADAYDDTIEWTLPGTGAGQSATTMTAYLTNGKVVYVQATTDSDYDTLVAIRNALSAKLKAQPKTDEDTGAWVWKKKPGFTLDEGYSSNRFTLSFGKDPSL